MRLNTYISEGRSRQIPESDALELLKTKHSDAFKSKSLIYRGIRGSTLPYLYVNSDEGEPRISRNTYNYYTLIMDNSPSWKNYPKRSRSLICTTDFNYSTSYGITYIVYPENDTKIGVCPTDDIWGSFEEYNGEVSMRLDIMCEKIAALLDVYSLRPKIVTYGSLVNAFDVIDYNMHTDDVKKSQYYNSPSYFKTLYDAYLKSRKPFLKFMEDVLDPKRNKFDIAKVGDDLPNYNEVWLSGPCVLVREGI